jgi:atypical dual specificity phosphatase
MISNFAYVRDGQLAGCAHPGWGISLHETLAELADRQGITAVVTLTPEPLPADVLAEFNLRSYHLPIPDFGVPDMEKAGEAVEFVQGEIGRGGRVLIHCDAGYGRTGTILACCLAALDGGTAEEAIRVVRQRRPGTIENALQERFVRDWVSWWRRRAGRRD